ncbi:protein of unknown function [Taphrina deformans PYCC 5710]|uniref:Hyaluronan/mRNA-binding protein domain-containing protein n=1 Tax=Taphrina deformans (strain PYCC 5710 / ATCC 11124 / CBS 356.35 / IMI 108563 / JCM 9778 / NBRC 8474) TaxID=1097556 RepID=R4X8H8_TAPDE|nr:protein of unknown function [Taphrina deformans PYCC 5710]|eukprot:CCG81914.1 protein of unknown function [Taphrina deformans PYCC 5710]
MTHTNRISNSGPKHSDTKGHILDPSKTAKRSGAGKGNWGSAQDDIHDLPEDFTLMKARRRSNSQSQSFEREKMISRFESDELTEED